MKKPRVVVAEFKHETNCFCPNKAGRKEYEDAYLKFDHEVLSYFRSTKTDVGGMMAAAEKEGFEIIPVMATFATPTGLTTADMFDFARDKILKAISESRPDGVLLSLHGAMVAENAADGEGVLLQAIRDKVGSQVPIISTLDLHGNVTYLMVENANAFFPYETYPHVDGYERGYEAGICLMRILKKEIAPVMRLKHIPLLAQPIETASEPHARLLQKVHQWEENPKVVNVAIMHGFPWSDIPDATMSVLSVTDGDNQLAGEIGRDLAQTIWEKRDQFRKKFLTQEEAVKEALAFPEGPVIIADVADTPGGGGTSDSTFVLRELLKAGAKNTALALIRDPQSVEQAISAGVGNRVKLTLGGKYAPDEVTGGALGVQAYVKTITDGVFMVKGPMTKGLQVNRGRSVVLDIDGNEVIVVERHLQAYDQEVLRRMGIEPREKKIIVLKSAIHYKASFLPIAKKILDVDTPEYLTMNFEALPFKHLRRPVYPLDRNFEYLA